MPGLTIPEKVRISRIPWITISLVAVSSFSLIYTVYSGDSLIFRWGYVPREPTTLSVFLYIFTSYVPPIWGMSIVYFGLVGSRIESVLGSPGYAFCLLFISTVNLAIYHALNAKSNYPVAGLSGLVVALMSMYTVFFRNSVTRFYDCTPLGPISFRIPVRWAYILWLSYLLPFVLASNSRRIFAAFLSPAISGAAIGFAIAFISERMGIIANYRQILNDTRTSLHSVICPSCSNETPAPKFGRHICQHCQAEYYFDSKGVRYLMHN